MPEKFFGLIFEFNFLKTHGMVKTGSVVEEGAKGGGKNSRVNGGEFLR